MTPAQKRLRELRDRQSRERGRMAELSLLDELDAETRSELDKIEKGTPDLERQLRAATVALGDDDAEARAAAADGDPNPTGEDRERIELRRASRLGNYLVAALQGRGPSGAEAELAAAAGVGGIPLELFDPLPEHRAAARETRAPTGAPSTVGVNLDPIRPLIYARAITPRIGVAMPRVPSGTYATATIATGTAAGARAKDAAAVDTAATFAVGTTTPHSVSGKLSIRIEDVASVGNDNFESALRQELMLSLSSELDRLVLNGNATTAAAEPNGLFVQITPDPADPTAVVTFNAFVALSAGGIDGGPWAETMTSVMLLVNPETMRLAEATFQTAASYQGEMSAAAYLRRNSGGFLSSRRMPDTDTTIAQAIRFRAGTMGLDGVDAMRTATCPVWAEIGIDDIYTDSAKGIRHFTLHSLIGDVLLVQPSAYEQVAVKLAT